MLSGSKKYRALVGMGKLAYVTCIVVCLELFVSQEYLVVAAIVGMLVLLSGILGISSKCSRELYQENQRMLAVANLSGSLIFEYDAGTGDINWLGDGEQIFRAKERELTLEALIHPEDWPFTIQQMEDLKRDKIYSINVRILDASGEYCFCRCRMVAMKNEWGRITQTLGIIEPGIADRLSNVS